MLWRFLLTLALFVCFCRSSAVFAVDPTIENTDPTTMEWKVSYEGKEDFSMNLNYKKRPMAAIRLKVRKNSNNTYSGKLWVFSGVWNTTTMKTDYTLAGKTDDWFDLVVKGDAVGRDRTGFQAKQVDLNTGGGKSKKINVNGIWQYGRNKTRASQRIVLKINHNIPPPWGNCEDDPDSDVLEEGGSPPGDDDPPSEP